jgi:hypothetical protein
MPQERTINVQWITEESDTESVRHALEAEGAMASVEPWEPDADTAEEFGDSQLEPMMIIAVAVAARLLIRTVSDVLLDWKRPDGVLIDTTGEKLLVRPDPQASRPGDLVILTKEGTQPHVFRAEERDQGLKELAQILELYG